MLDQTIIDHIAAGNFDRELGEIARDPKYAEYTAMELKSVLTDRIADSLLPEQHRGLVWPLRVGLMILVLLLGVAVTYNTGG